MFRKTIADTHKLDILCSAVFLTPQDAAFSGHACLLTSISVTQPLPQLFAKQIWNLGNSLFHKNLASQRKGYEYIWNTRLENADLNHVILVSSAQKTNYVRDLQYWVYPECTGIEVGNLTWYILCKWLLRSLFATRKSSFFHIVNSPKVKKKSQKLCL